MFLDETYTRWFCRRPATPGERWHGRFSNDARHGRRVAGGRLVSGDRLRRGHVPAVPQGRRRRRRRRRRRCTHRLGATHAPRPPDLRL